MNESDREGMNDSDRDGVIGGGMNDSERDGTIGALGLGTKESAREIAEGGADG